MKKILLGLIMLGLVGCAGLDGAFGKTLVKRKETLLDYNQPKIELETTQGVFAVDLKDESLKFEDKTLKFKSFKVSFVNPKTKEELFTDGINWYKITADGRKVLITEIDTTNFILFGIKVQ